MYVLNRQDSAVYWRGRCSSHWLSYYASFTSSVSCPEQHCLHCLMSDSTPPGAMVCTLSPVSETGICRWHVIWYLSLVNPWGFLPNDQCSLYQCFLYFSFSYYFTGELNPVLVMNQYVDCLLQKFTVFYHCKNYYKNSELNNLKYAVIAVRQLL